MWYLNFCSPFIYELEGSVKTSRIVMYSTLLALFACYTLHNIIFKAVGKEIPMKAAYNKNDVIQTQKVIALQGIGNRANSVNEKKFKQWYTHYFGLHAVAMGAAIMYSPFISQMVFSLIWAVCFLACSILISCEKKGFRKILYNMLLVLCIVLDIILLFTATMGVGASGYDNTEKICYWQR